MIYISHIPNIICITWSKREDEEINMVNEECIEGIEEIDIVKVIYMI